MREWKSQSHVKWYCKYHIVFSPKYRKKAMFGSLRKGVGKILRELCNQSGVELVEGHAMSDHVHLCLSIPPKYSVANTVGFLKGKSAIRIHREYGEDEELHGVPFLGTLTVLALSHAGTASLFESHRQRRWPWCEPATDVRGTEGSLR